MARVSQQPVPPTVVRDPRSALLASPDTNTKIRGCLAALKARAGDRYERLGMALTAGHSWEVSANLAGLTLGTVRTYQRKYPDVSELLGECESVGFAIYELELQQRALAGSDDRNSARLLEILLKARRAEYREKQQLSIDVMHRAESRLADVVGGWDVGTDSDSQLTQLT